MKCGRLMRERTGSRKYALFGQEAIGCTWALAKMNMFLHGEDNHRIEWGDTIRNPKLLDRRPADALRRGRRQPAVQPGEVGLREAPTRTSSAASAAVCRPRPRATTPSSCTWSRP